MPVGEIQAAADAVYVEQVDNEMGTARYALLFKPGVYGSAEDPLQMKVGYYTEVAGLGASPGDVMINGKIEVYNRCLEGGGTTNCLALVNFWRTLSNLTLNVNAPARTAAGLGELLGGLPGRLDAPGQRPRRQALADGLLHGRAAVRQRRLHRRLGAPGTSLNGSQQQWLTRDSEIGGWTNGVWNQVFAGVAGAPSDAAFPDPPYTTSHDAGQPREAVPVRRRRGRLQGPCAVGAAEHERHVVGRRHDGGAHHPAARLLRREAVGLGEGDQQALAAAGTCCYPRRLRHRPQPLRQARRHGRPRPGARDAHRGRRRRPARGRRRARRRHRRRHDRRRHRRSRRSSCRSASAGHGTRQARPCDPTTLSDVYFRVGGPHIGKVDIALEVNSDNVLIDHTWVWRADHGVEGFSDTERWNTNSGATASSSTVTTSPRPGLFVEHFQQYNTIWNGETAGRSCTRTSCRTTRRTRRSGCTTASRAGPATRSATG